MQKEGKRKGGRGRNGGRERTIEEKERQVDCR